MNNRIFKSTRIAAIFVIMAVLLSIYTSALYDLQITKGDNYLEASRNAIATTRTIQAPRGSILDRNGVPLVYDRTVYNVVINRSILMRDDSPNSIILELCNLCDEHNIEYTDTFPVTEVAPFSYVADMDDTQRSRLGDYYEYFNLKDSTMAADLISWMRQHYGVDYTLSVADARKILGVRYEMECRLITMLPDYLFIEDATADEISVIMEQDFPGVEVQTSTKREYATPYAAHLLGYVGKMDSETYEKYKDKPGYGVNTDIGQDGVEAAFEEYLHGINGSVTYTTDEKGNVTGILSETPAEGGNNLYLTIDIDLQAAAEDALKNTIEDINANKKEDEDSARGGAVVVRDVNSGEVLVLASYPSYDPATIKENYNELAADELEPIFNRATLGEYNPGSTFKMVTALAGLKTGKITENTWIEDKVVYTEYSDYQPRCWKSSGHGNLNVVGALENSCNYFFYTISEWIGIDAIESVAREFGFGQKTGIEIAESAGVVASREYKKEVLNDGWWAADTLITSIGQGHNNFTPLQIASYVAAIANDGTVYGSTLLRYIKSADYSETIKTHGNSIISQVEDDGNYLSILRRGMRAVAATGTAAATFADYPVKIAAKTGTVQTEASAQNTGVFVCYAPYDNPQIAISVVVEGGRSGSALAGIAKEILDVYFDSDTVETVKNGEYSLIR